jgi:cytoskeleton protein RodZ
VAATLGETLKERRQQLGIALPDVEQHLHIRAKLLEALEAGDYDRLPNPGYVRAYITTYARYLDLDPQPLLSMYHTETGHGRFHSIELPETAVKSRHEQHALSWRAALAAVTVIALASLAIWIGVTLVRGPETPPPIAPEPTPTASGIATSTSTASGTVEASSATQPVVPKPASPQPFTLKVAVESGGASWLEIKVDGTTEYADVADGPTSKEYRVKKTAQVRIGRPSVVSVFQNGDLVTVTEKNGIGSVSLVATSPAQ